MTRSLFVLMAFAALSWTHIGAQTVDAWLKEAESSHVVTVKILDTIRQTCGAHNTVTIRYTTDGHLELKSCRTLYFERGDRIVPVTWQDGDVHRATPHPAPNYPLLGYVKAVRSDDGGTISWHPLEVKIGNHPREIMVRRLNSLVGQKTRYVAVSTVRSIFPDRPFPTSNYTGIYLDERAMANQAPARGFETQDDDFSCGPVAGLNLLRWYGIEEFEPNLTLDRLRREMGTTAQGTKPDSFFKVVRNYLKKHIGDYYGVRHDRREIGKVKNGLHRLVEYQLASGHPVVVSYETGPDTGHLAVIVGLVAVRDEDSFRGMPHPSYVDPSNDLVLIANGNTLRWDEFAARWERWNGNLRVFLTADLYKGYDINKSILTNSLGAGMLAGVYDAEAVARDLEREEMDFQRQKQAAERRGIILQRP